MNTALRRAQCVVALACLIAPSAWAEKNEKLDFSGFARAVVGVTSEEDVVYAGYDDKLAADVDSLVGLQIEYEVSDQLDLVGQAIAHSNDRKDSGLEWLYLNYQPISSLDIKLGLMQSPFFSISDVIYVGYAYPWALPPQEIYSGFVFSNFKGLDVVYTGNVGGVVYRAEGYYGRFDDSVFYFENETPVKVDFGGLISEVIVDRLKFRFSYHHCEFETEPSSDLLQLIQSLEQAQFFDQAKLLDFAGNASFIHGSAEYENLQFFSKLEASYIDPNDGFSSKIRGAYLSGGMYFGDFTAYGTLAQRSYDEPSIENPIFNRPGLGQLAEGFQRTIDSRYVGKINTYTLGTRWDIRPNIAIKAEAKFLDSSERESDIASLPDNSLKDDISSTLYLFGVDVVF